MKPARHYIKRLSLLRLKQDARGVAIIEFGLVVIPLVALILAAIQTSIMLFSQQAMETASEKVARLVMTGQAQTASMSQSAFKNLVCSKLPSYIACSSVMVDVVAYSDISQVDTQNPTLTYNNGNVTNSWSYDLGDEGEVVRMRVMYLAPSAYGPLGFTLANQSSGKRLMISTSVFRNESS